MKKLFAGLLCIAMLLTLAACNDDAEGTPYVPPTQANGTTVPSSEPDNDEPPVPDDTPVTVWLATDSVIYDENGEAAEKYQVTYDEKGNQLCLVEKVRYDTWDTYTTLYTYDENNLLLRETYYSPYFTLNYEYTYDSNGNMLSMDISDENGDPGGSYRYTYDTNGNCLCCVGYDENGVEDYRVDYVYNKQGKSIKRTVYYEGEFSSCEQYEYDENGNRILIISLNEDNEETSRTENVYGKNGKVYQSKESCDGAEISHTEYFYTDDGKDAKVVRYNGNEELHRIEYIYDDNGNLTEVITAQNGTLTERALISYTSITVLPQRAEEIKNAQDTLIHVYLS